MADVKTEYPERFYASYDTSFPEPHPILGWYDTWGLSSTANVPPASSMVAISAEDWNNISFRACAGKAVQAGKIIDYTPTSENTPSS
ncbi:MULTISPECIES: hypothetical protein [Acetobacter]|uniref:Uncharacterized protein n=1 Tax=Acetobacter tropicalis TaxID=104102 RepID=A0A291PGE8_9PROT|nr:MULTISPECIES: hypothetical protein [Acetobacter]ATJ90457.1 hypothetical protein CIW82_06890 [Acetobacter tropicalis]